jgi:Secretion system C-terminal sorting domain
VIRYNLGLSIYFTIKPFNMKKIFILFAGILLSFHGFSQSWLLTGNSGTTPPTNFLGTKDAQRLVFKTDSIERMTILANGNVGVGLTAPLTLLHVFSNTAGSQMAVSGAAPVISFFSGSTPGVSTGQLGFATAVNDFVGGAQAGDFILDNTDTAHSLIFGTSQTAGDGIERMRINKIGYIGIDKPSPTARLDINCIALSGQTNPSNVRLENLQSGSGTVLVIDSNGYVYKAASGQTAIATAATPLASDMQSQVQELQSQVQELRTLLATSLCLTKNQLSSLDAESATYLGDIHPNPANTSTTIDYSLPSGVGGALCQVYSLDGKVVTSISLPAVSGKSQVQLTTSQLAPGMYIYALVVDGKVLSSKKLAVVR